MASILTSIFASTTAHGAGPRELLAHRVDAAFTGGAVLVVIAMAVTVLVARVARAGSDASTSTTLDREPAGATVPDRVAA